MSRKSGSHGSITKAGKVRDSTPKVVGKVRKKPFPRMRHKRRYRKNMSKTIGKERW